MNEPGHKNVQPSHSTGELYLRAMSKFDEWLPGRSFESYEGVAPGGQPIQKSFGSVEELKEYCESSEHHGPKTAQHTILEYLATLQSGRTSASAQSIIRSAINLPPPENLFQYSPFALTAYLYLNGIFLTLTIRAASMADKSEILDFCRVLYPEGDYFEDTFDSWLAEKTMYAMWEGSKIVCAGCISVESGQGWIEGVRVHPDFGRRGYATELMKHAEQLMRSEGGSVVRTLVSIDNVPSLNLSRKCGYEIGDVWNWYEMYGTTGGRYRERIMDVDLAGMQYVDSWRLYDLNDCISVTSLDDGSSFTVIPSKHFPGTTLVTVLEATDLSGLASYVAEKIMPAARAGTGDGSGTETGDTHGWNAGIHIVSRLDASLFERDFKKIGSYYLTQKRL